MTQHADVGGRTGKGQHAMEVLRSLLTRLGRARRRQAKPNCRATLQRYPLRVTCQKSTLGKPPRRKGFSPPSLICAAVLSGVGRRKSRCERAKSVFRRPSGDRSDILPSQFRSLPLHAHGKARAGILSLNRSPASIALPRGSVRWQSLRSVCV